MKTYLYCLFFLLSSTTYAQDKDKEQILGVLERQSTYWNQGNLEKFMEGYWQHDSLMFIGKSGVTYGYANTLENYRNSYSDTVQMGKLKFDFIRVEPLSAEHYFVVGKWNLTRSVGNLSGHFSLIFRKIDGKWTIVADHSS